MGNALDDVSFASPCGHGEGVCAEKGAFGLFEDFRALLTGGVFFGEGGGEDFA